MGFETHLFISYAHLDNKPLSEEQMGWVSRFHASLEAILSTRLGREAKIWRDKKLAGNDIFADEILAQFPKTALLVSVLTPRYVESDWCTREALEFWKVVDHGSGVALDHKSRIIKVIKTPVDSEDHLPPVMKEMLGYPFYIFNEDQAPIELDPAYGADLAQKYNLKVAKLAWDIAQLLKKLDPVAHSHAAPATTADAAKPSIYLAECSYDQRDARDALESDLRLHGYRILPEHQMPVEEPDYVAEVSRLLTECKLSVHLVGSGYGAVPDGPSQKSVVVLQNELAIEHSRAAGLRRIIWLGKDSHSTHLGQQQFIDTLRKDGEVQFGADLITADLETMKAAVHAALQKIENPEPPRIVPPASAGAARSIYLICDERDRKATIPLRKFLKGAGHDVQIPLFEGEAATVRQANEDLLKQCDGVILFYGAGDESWKRSVESGLKKVKGSRPDQPLLAAFTYLAEPSTAAKKDLVDLEEPNLINALNGFSEPAMQPFLAALAGVGR